MSDEQYRDDSEPARGACGIPDEGMIASATGMRARDQWEMPNWLKRKPRKQQPAPTPAQEPNANA